MKENKKDIIWKIVSEFELNEVLVNNYIEDYLKWEDYNTIRRFFKENIDFIKVKPFVKWVGWKRQLMPILIEEYPLDKKIKKYYEPFLGWGALFLNVQKKNSILSDINKELINAYQVIKDNVNDLIKFLKTLRYDKELFLEIRAWDREEWWEEKYWKIKRAWRFIFLNRTCFNGLYRVNSKGYFNVPFWRYTNPDFIQEENLINLSRLFNFLNIKFKISWFEEVLENAWEGDFIYLDPPYDTINETSNFTSYDKSWFGKELQVTLAETFKKLDKKGAYVMLSNHDTDFIKEIYDWYKFKIVKARRNINSKGDKRGEVNEIIIKNY